MAPDDPSLIDLDSTRDAHDRIFDALRHLTDNSRLNPEASTLRSLLHTVSVALKRRAVRAHDSNYYEREIQFLVDLRTAIDDQLTTNVPWAQQREGVSWQRLGDLLGISRQAAWERYRYHPNVH